MPKVTHLKFRDKNGIHEELYWQAWAGSIPTVNRSPSHPGALPHGSRFDAPCPMRAGTCAK